MEFLALPFFLINTGVPILVIQSGVDGTGTSDPEAMM